MIQEITIETTANETIENRLIRLARIHNSGFSAGAYGDEGQMIIFLDQLIEENLEGNPTAPLIMTGMRFNQIPETWWVWIDRMIRDVLDGWKPMRFTVDAKSLIEGCRRARVRLWKYHDAHPDVDPEQVARVVSWVERNMRDRTLMHIERGGFIWRVLFEQDLFFMLAPFIRVTEPQAES